MKSHLRVLLVTLTFLLPGQSYAQYFPDTAWTRCYGGSLDDEGLYIQQTFDGGYIVLGKSESVDGDLVNAIPDVKSWILKLDSLGNIEWQRSASWTMGMPFNIKQTADSGYIYGGLLFTKLDLSGNLLWQDSTSSGWVIQTYDGGYGLLGSMLRKLSYTLNQEWVADPGMGGRGSIEQTRDSGFVVGKFFDYDQGPDGHEFVKYHSDGSDDFFTGVSVGSTGIDISVKETADNSFIAVSTGSDYTDIWGYLRKGSQTTQWYKTMFDRYPSDIIQNTDSTFVFCGIDTFDNAIVSKTTPQGTDIVTVSYGGSNNYDKLKMLVGTKDSGYIAIGTTNSSDGHIWNNHGGKDLWIMKFKTDTSFYIPPVVQSVNSVSKIDEVKVYPTLSNGVVHVSLPQRCDDASFELFNIVGEKIEIKTETVGTKRNIDISKQAPGHYVLQVQMGNERKSFRITINQ